jgi:hypothetical protein
METLRQLTQQRARIVEQIAQLGAMRMGSVRQQTLPTRRKDGSVYRRGPYWTYTFKQGGRTRGKHLRDDRQAEFYGQQIEAFRRYQALSRELVQVRQALADLEAGEQGAGKKNPGADRSRTPGRDRANHRTARRRSRCGSGGRGVLYPHGFAPRRRPRLCANGPLPRKMESAGVREKTLQTILGPARFGRSRYICPECGAVQYPGHARLGVAGTGFSPGMRRLMTRAGAQADSFAAAAEDLELYGAIRTDPKDIERVAENTGRLIDDWMQGQGAAAALGLNPDSPDDQGRPLRDRHSTTYVGAIESSSDFGHRLRRIQRRHRP